MSQHSIIKSVEAASTCNRTEQVLPAGDLVPRSRRAEVKKKKNYVCRFRSISTTCFGHLHSVMLTSLLPVFKKILNVYKLSCDPEIYLFNVIGVTWKEVNYYKTPVQQFM